MLKINKSSVEAKFVLKFEIYRIIQYELQGTGMTCTRCVSNTGHPAYGNSKGETRR